MNNQTLSIVLPQMMQGLAIIGVSVIAAIDPTVRPLVVQVLLIIAGGNALTGAGLALLHVANGKPTMPVPINLTVTPSGGPSV